MSQEVNETLAVLVSELGELYRMTTKAMVGQKWPGNDAQRELVNYLAAKGKVDIDQDGTILEKILTWEELLGKEANHAPRRR